MLSNYDDGTVTRVGPVENDQGVANTIVLKRANSPTQTTAVCLGTQALRMDGKSSLVYQHNGKQDQHIPHRRKSKPALPPRSQHSAKIHPSYADKHAQ